MTLQEIEKELVALVEAEGPAVLGVLLTAVAGPAFPVAAVVELAAVVAQILQAKTEAEQFKAAEAGVDAATDLAEAEALKALGK